MAWFVENSKIGFLRQSDEPHMTLAPVSGLQNESEKVQHRGCRAYNSILIVQARIKKSSSRGMVWAPQAKEALPAYAGPRRLRPPSHGAATQPCPLHASLPTAHSALLHLQQICNGLLSTVQSKHHCMAFRLLLRAIHICALSPASACITGPH